MFARFPYRIVVAKWNTERESGEFNVQLFISGKDKVGMINTITEIIAKEFKLNLRAITIHPRKDNLFEGVIITSVNNSKQLNNLIDRLKKIEDVYEVKRKVK
jgi:GTP pyrophosphokinase